MNVLAQIHRLGGADDFRSQVLAPKADDILENGVIGAGVGWSCSLVNTAPSAASVDVTLEA